MIFSYSYLFVLSFWMSFTFSTSPTLEKERINDIDFKFSLDGSNILINGSFLVEAEAACPRFITYDFGHKKKYTKTAITTFEKDIIGDNWYDIHFVVEKYMFARVESYWRYSMDEAESRVYFELKSYNINISGMNLVNSSDGYFEFIQEGANTRINYVLDYKLKPTRWKNYVFKIQKKESIKILSDYKTYLEETCPL